MTDIPRAYRPLKNALIAMHDMISDDSILRMSHRKFTEEMLRKTGGAPISATIYGLRLEIIDEAGADPDHTSPASPRPG